MRHGRGQTYESDEVIAELGGTSFMTRRGIVIEGNYQVGDQVPVIFDRSSKRYMPAYKKETHRSTPLALVVTVDEKKGTCQLEPLEAPLVVQPMRYPGVIGRGQVGAVEAGYPETYHFPVETEGVDYIKTYYSIIVPAGMDLEWLEGCTPEICAALPHENPPRSCSPFVFKDESVPHKEARCAGSGFQPEEPTNHCLESMYGCFAEVIESGEDSNGTFILWKAYSEYFCWNPTLLQLLLLQSRTGYGILRLRVALRSKSGIELCYTYVDVIMDCCKKDPDLRVPELWWDYEECDGNPTQYPYGGAAICPAPELVDSWPIWRWGYQYFYMPPEITGACLPYRWELSGPGYLENACSGFEHVKAIESGTSCTYLAPEDVFENPTCAPAVLTVTDRCGRTDHIHIDCCMADAQDPDISIGELDGLDLNQMGCGYTYHLTANGGCPPWHWTLSGEGSLVVVDPKWGDMALYTSPGANPMCATRPTITVTDCCGKTASIHPLINCWSTAGTAGKMCSGGISPPYIVTSCSAGYVYGYVSPATFYTNAWNCEGVIIEECGHSWQIVNAPECNIPWCPGAGSGFGCCYAGLDVSQYCTDPGVCISPGWCGACTGSQFGGSNKCGTFDLRTEIMKLLGCCPIDPNTGESMPT